MFNPVASPVLHAGICGACHGETDCPHAMIYDQPLNDRIKLCSEKCFKLFMTIKRSPYIIPYTHTPYRKNIPVLSPRGYKESPV